MSMKSLTVAAIAAALATSLAPFTNAAGLDIFQKKVDAATARAGVAPVNVKEEIAGANKGQTSVKPADTRKLPKIRRMSSMPATQIRAIEGSDGRMLYLVDNGRFAISGQMVDVWNRRVIGNLDEFDDAISHIDLRRMGFRLNETNHITVGKGQKRVTIFVDPRCGWCHKLLEEIKGDASYMEKYTFDIVILHVLGDESAALAKKLHCAKTDDQTAKFNALVAGKSAIDKLEQQDKCDIKQLRSTVVQQHALQINSVPFIITSDKRFVRGKPQDVRGFLDDELAKKQADEARAKRQEEIKKALDAVQGRESKPAANDASKGADNAGSTKVTPKTK